MRVTRRLTSALGKNIGPDYDVPAPDVGTNAQVMAWMAEKVLLEKGVEVLPAILCNAGGVTVSYFEWKQNRQSETWDHEVVDRELRKTMVRSAHRVLETAERLNCGMRLASYAAAIAHINNVYEIREVFP